MSDVLPLISLMPLRHDVHVAQRPDGLIFLDVAGDAYLSLYTPSAPTALDGSAPVVDIERLRSLLDDARLLADIGPAPCQRCKAPEWRELIAPAPTRPPAAVIAGFMLALLAASWRFHTRRFSGLVDWATNVPGGASAVDEQDLARMIGWFDRLYLWLPVRPLCLFRAFFLLHFLRRFDLDARWVFGVSLFPFHAHCWLARDDLLVGERTHRADEFTIILSTDGQTG